VEHGLSHVIERRARGRSLRGRDAVGRLGSRGRGARAHARGRQINAGEAEMAPHSCQRFRSDIKCVCPNGSALEPATPTIANANIPPPRSWDEFEDIVLSAAKRRWSSTEFYRHGRQEQRQRGESTPNHSSHRATPCISRRRQNGMPPSRRRCVRSPLSGGDKEILGRHFVLGRHRPGSRARSRPAMGYRGL
jgi:hypothetical protein